MGKRKRKKLSSTLTWKAAKGFFRLLFKGGLKASPFFVLGLIVFGIFWVIRGELYADSSFLIGTVKVNPEGVLSAAKLQELGKQYLKKNLFTISLQEVAARVKEDPGIRQARAVREFPQTLRIEIENRSPFVQVQIASKKFYYWVAEDGVVLGEAKDRDRNFLILEAPEVKISGVAIGEKIPLKGFDEAIHFVRVFWNHPLARTEKIERLSLDHLGNISLTLEKGPELRLGREALKKMGRLNSLAPLLKAAERDRILYMDLQYKDLIVKKKAA